MASGSTIRVGALIQGGGEWVWLHTRGHHSSVRQTKRWGYGDWSLEFDYRPPRGRWPLALEAGRIIEQWYGGRRVWGGLVENVDRDSGRVTAAGFCRLPEKVYALDGGGQATSKVGVAVLASSTFPGARSLTPYGMLQDPDNAALFKQMPPATEANKQGALFDAFAKLNGRRWWIGSNRLLSFDTDPTRPSLYVATSERFGVSTEALCTRMLVGYRNTLGEYHVTPPVLGPGAARASVQIEKLMDVSDHGPMTQAAAIDLGQKALKLAGEQAALTGSVTVRRRQVVNAGGARVHPVAMLPGLIYRFQGQPDPRSNALYTDALIGETVWDEEEGTVQLTPMEAEREDLQATIEALGGQLEAA